MKKRMTAILLAAAMCLSLLPASVFAAEEQSVTVTEETTAETAAPAEDGEATATDETETAAPAETATDETETAAPAETAADGLAVTALDETEAAATLAATADAEVYVSEGGSDSNSGTEDSPYATLYKAVNAIRSTGGTIYVTGTVTDSGNRIFFGTYSTNIVIEGLGTDAVVQKKATGADSTGDAMLVLSHASNGDFKGSLTIKNLTLDSTAVSGNPNLLANWSYTGKDDVNLTLQNVTFKSASTSENAMVFQKGTLTMNNVTFDNGIVNLGTTKTITAAGPVTATGTVSITNGDTSGGGTITRDSSFTEGAMLQVGASGTEGNLTLSGVTLQGDGETEMGKIIEVVDGSVTMTSATVQNFVGSAGTDYMISVDKKNTASTLTMDASSALKGNTVNGTALLGVGYGNTATLTGTTVTGNMVNSDGGYLLLAGTVSGSKLTLNGAAVTSNTVSDTGYALRAGSAGGASNVLVQGATQITGNTTSSGDPHNVYLLTGGTLALDSALSSGASIGVTTQTAPGEGAPVTVATGSGSYTAAEADAGYFTSDSDAYLVVYKDSAVKLSAGDDYYVSSGGSDESGDGSKTTPFATIAKAYSQIGTRGTIHVMDHLTLTAQMTFDGGKTVTILSDSNGVLDDGEAYTVLRGASGYTMLYISAGSVTLKDIVFDGNNVANAYNAVRVMQGATLTLGEGSVIQNNKTGGSDTPGNTTGAGVCVYGTLNIDGGVIRNNFAYSRGGGVTVYDASAVVNMTAGEITGNTIRYKAYYGGGGVYIEKGTFNMSGGSITGNSDPCTEGYGGGVYLVSGGALNVSGSAVITGNTAGANNERVSNVYLGSNVTMTITGPLTNGASIGVAATDTPTTADAPVTVAAGGGYTAGEADAAAFFSDDAAYQTYFKDADTPSVVLGTLSDYYVSSKGDDENGDGTPENPYATLAKAYETVYPGGTIHVMDDLTLDSSLTVSKSVTILSDDADAGTTDDQFTITRGTGLTSVTMLTVTGEGVEATLQNIIFDGNKANMQSINALRVEKKATLTLDAGAVVQNNKTGRGSGETNDGAGVVVNAATLNIKPGAAIQNNETYGRGGGVSTRTDDAVVNMIGGAITGNKNINGNYPQGGGVYLEKGAFNMSGGSISGNSAPFSNGLGGGVYSATGTLCLSGAASITGNTSGASGSEKADNVYLQSGQTVTVAAALTDGANIGVTTAVKPDATTNVTVAVGGTGHPVSESDAGYFASDNAEYSTEFDADAPSVVLGPSKDYYVSSTGSDDNNGTMGYPYLTIAAAYSAVPDGGTIHVMDALTLDEMLSLVTDKTVTIIADSDGDLDDDEQYTITRTSNFAHPMLYVKAGTVTLKGVVFDGDNIGISCGGSSSGISVIEGATLTISKGAGLTNSLNTNTTASWTSAGVRVSGNSAKVILEPGGFITNNTGHDGGGVLAYMGGTFIMNGGTISGNRADNGPGVYADGYGSSYISTLTLNGGVITNNYCTGDNPGGVMVHQYANVTIGSVAITKNGAAAGKVGAGVNYYSSTGTTVTLTGTPVIENNTVGGSYDETTHTVTAGDTVSNLYLPSGYTVAIGSEGLKSGASIGVTTAATPTASAPVTVATGAETGDEAYFFSDVAAYSTEYDDDNNAVVLSIGNNVYVSSSGSDSTGNGTPAKPYATLAKALEAAGEGAVIHVMSDLTLSATVAISQNVTIVSDSDGDLNTGEQYTLTRSGSFTGIGSNTTLFQVKGGTAEFQNLTIDGNQAVTTASYPAISVTGGAAATLSGATTLTNHTIGGDNSDMSDKGVIYLSGGTLNIQDEASITGNNNIKTTTTNLVIQAYGTGNTVNMTGGSITGNQMRSAAISVGSALTLNVSGTAAIRGNTDMDGNAADVSLETGYTVTVAGELSEGASIGVTTATAPSAGSPVTVAVGGASYTVTEGDAGHFFSDAAYSIDYNDTGKTVVLSIGNDLYVSATGNDETGNGTPAKPYATLAKALEVAGEGAVIHVMSDLTLTAALTISQNVAIVADSDGDLDDNDTATLTRDSSFTSGSMFTVSAGYALTLQGLTLEGSKISVSGLIEQDGGGAVYVNSGATLNATNCTFQNHYIPAARYGPAISSAGTSTITNCVFKDNYTSSSGSAVFVHGGEMTITGGEFTGNKCNSSQGALFVRDGTVTVTGASFTGNTAAYGGAAVYQDGGAVTLDNVSITGNSITGGTDRGAVWVNGDSATLTVLDGATISGNTGCSGVYLVAGTLNLDGGAITGNALYGVNVAGGTLNLSGDVTVTGNTSGNLYLPSGVTANLTAALGENASIGVTTADTPAANAPVIVAVGGAGSEGNAYAVTEGDAGHFFSDAAYSTEYDATAPSVVLTLRKDYYVSATGSDSNPGTMDSPYLTLATAYSAVLDGGTIHVMDDLTLTAGLTVEKNVAIVADKNGDLTDGDTAVITRDSSFTSGSMFTVGEGYALILQGLTLDGNSASIDSNGGGVYIDTGATLTATNCVFQNHKLVNTTATHYGAAVYNHGTAAFTGCTFQNNSLSTTGPAIYNGETAALTVTDCAVTGNECTSSEGAISVDNGTAIITNTTFTENKGTYAGPALRVFGGTVTLKDVSITGNSITGNDDRGAVYVRGCYSDVTLNMSGVTITENGAAGGTACSGIYMNNVSDTHGMTLNLSDSSITNNTGYGVYLISGTLNLSGDVQITNNTNGNLYLPSGVAANLTAALGENASIGVTTATAPTATAAVTVAVGGGHAVTEADAARFFSDVAAYTTEFDAATPSVVLTLRKDYYVSATGSDETGDGTMGNPYATIAGAYTAANTAGVTSVTIHVMSDLTVTTRMHPEGTTTKTIAVVADSDGDLTDGETFTITRGFTGTYSDDNSLFYVKDGYTMTLRGLTLDGQNRSITERGLGVFVASGGTLTATDCVFLNHTTGSSKYGSAVYSEGTTTLTNCEIKDNTTGGKGAVAIGGGTLNLSGDVQITNNTNGNLYLSSGVTANLTAALGKNASIGVTTATAPTASAAVTVAVGSGHAVTEADAARFFSDVTTYTTEFDAATPSVVLTIRKDYYVSAQKGSDSNPGTMDSPYLTLATAYSNVPAGGTIHVMDDLTLTAGLTIAKNVTIVADNDGDLTDGDTAAITRSSSFSTAMLTVSDGYALTLRGLTLDGGSVTLSFSGGGVVVSSGAALTAVDCTFQKHIVSGDYISGAAVYNSGTAAIENCLFQNNTAQVTGPAIYNADTGTLTVTGCTITGNTNTQSEGSVGVDGGTAVITKTVFTGNTGKYGGAAMRVFGGTATLGEGVEIYGNTLAGGTDRGAVYVRGYASAATLNVRDGAVIRNNGTTSATCSGIYVYQTAEKGTTINLGDCSITGNTGYGVYPASSTTLNLSGEVKITGNTNGNLYLLSTSVTANVTGALTSAAKVGVTQSGAAAGKAFAVGSGYTVTESDAAAFFDDTKTYGVAVSGSKLVWASTGTATVEELYSYAQGTNVTAVFQVTYTGTPTSSYTVSVTGGSGGTATTQGGFYGGNYVVKVSGLTAGTAYTVSAVVDGTVCPGGLSWTAPAVTYASHGESANTSGYWSTDTVAYRTDTDGTVTDEVVSGIAYRVLSDQKIDVQGYGKTRTTYANAGWTPLTVGTDSLQVWASPTIVSGTSGADYVVLTYYVRNNSGNAQENVWLGANADIMIGVNDKAPVYKESYGLRTAASTDADALSFAIITQKSDAGVAAKADTVSTLWFGYWKDRTANTFKNTTATKLTGTDSGAAFSWKIGSLAAGAVASRSVVIGVAGQEDQKQDITGTFEPSGGEEGPDTEVTITEERLTLSLTPVTEGIQFQAAEGQSYVLTDAAGEIVDTYEAAADGTYTFSGLLSTVEYTVTTRKPDAETLDDNGNVTAITQYTEGTATATPLPPEKDRHGVIVLNEPEKDVTTLTYTFPGATAQILDTDDAVVTDGKFYNISVMADSGSFTLTGDALTALSGYAAVSGLNASGSYVTSVSADATYTYLIFSFTDGIAASSVQDFLQKLTFTAEGYGVSQTVEVDADVIELPGGVVRLGSSYYRYVAYKAVTWSNAYKAAKNSAFNGLTGYLMTVDSALEHNFVYQAFGSVNGWMGGLRTTATSGFDTAAYAAVNPNKGGTWKWVCGPNTGTEFWKGYSSSTSNAVTGVYSNWKSGEPNNSTYEYAAQYGFGTAGRWNDYKPTNSAIGGYFIEYTAYGDQTAASPMAHDEKTTEFGNGVIVSTGGVNGTTGYENVEQTLTELNKGDGYHSATQVLRLTSDISDPTAVTVNTDVYLDLNGHSDTIQALALADGVTLYGMDSATDGYNDATPGKLVFQGDVTGQVAPITTTTAEQTNTAKRYVAVAAYDRAADTTTVEFHRFNVWVTKLSGTYWYDTAEQKVSASLTYTMGVRGDTAAMGAIKGLGASVNGSATATGTLDNYGISAAEPSNYSTYTATLISSENAATDYANEFSVAAAVSFGEGADVTYTSTPQTRSLLAVLKSYYDTKATAEEKGLIDAFVTQAGLTDAWAALD